MARKQLEAFAQHTANKREKRVRAPVESIHDRRATEFAKGVIPAATRVPCPSGDGTLLDVIRNIRGDTLAALRSRKQIDEHQYLAGRHWETVWRYAEIGGIKAANPMKEPVDGGGGIVDPLTDRQRKAVSELRRADADLGIKGAVLIRNVLGRGIGLDAIAKNAGSGTERDRVYFGRLFRDCLDTLAVTFCYADRKLTCQANHLESVRS